MSHSHRQARSLRPHVVTGVLGVVLLAASAIACSHSEAVQAIEDDVKAGLKGNDGNGGGNVPVNPIHKEGVRSTEVLPLKPIATVVNTAPVASIVVEEANRTSCPAEVPVRDEYLPTPEIQAEAQGLLSRMDIDQKVVQLTGLGAPNYNDGNRWEDIQRSRDDTTLNIKGYQWRDGPHGLNLEAGLGRRQLPNYSTSFPTSVVQGATFDLDLVNRVGEAMGDETVAAGNNVLLAPCMNILRNPLWGRAQETFGEDVFHLGRIATALTLGLQEHVTGCAKHFAANNIEARRFFQNAAMDEQTLREIYGRHFEMVVREGGIGCIMASYNQVQGTKATQNKHLLTDVLRNDFGFQGFVLTDWWAMPGANIGQGPVDAPQDLVNAAQALEAGLDVEVPWAVNYDAIPGAVLQGTISGQLVDTAVRRVLEQKARFKSLYINQKQGLKDTTRARYNAAGYLENIEGHAELAAEAAEKGIVLLKNGAVGGKPVLPISGVTTLGVVGAIVDYTVRSDNPRNKKFNFLTDAALGDRGSSRVRPTPELTIGPLAGIQAAAAAAGGVQIVSGSTAAEVASADLIVVVVGLTPGDEGEEYTGAADRENLDLPKPHLDLIASVQQLGKPFVVVIEAGGAVSLPFAEQASAVVMAWYPGQQGGKALGRLLFGQANFSGRLPITWPRSLDQFPVFNEGNDNTTMDYFVGYRWFDQHGHTPLYPFGYGLSYSTFVYERLHIPCSDVSANGVINVEVDVRNTMGPAGEEVIQVYASYPETQGRRSKKELKGFAKVALAAGEAKRVTIPIRVQDLKYFNIDSNRWIVEEGPVQLHVGPNSGNLVASQIVNVN